MRSGMFHTGRNADAVHAQAEEMEQAALQPAAAPGELAVVVRGGEFAWETGAPSILRDINLQATAGQLVIVVGEVGTHCTLQAVSQRTKCFLCQIRNWLLDRQPSSWIAE